MMETGLKTTMDLPTTCFTDSFMFDEDSKDLWTQVYQNYPENSLLNDALEELKTSTSTEVESDQKTTTTSSVTKDSLSGELELADLESYLGLDFINVEPQVKIEVPVKEETLAFDSTLEFNKDDDVFIDSLLDDNAISDIQDIFLNRSFSLDETVKVDEYPSATVGCYSNTQVVSDTTVVMTASSCLSDLMKISGITTDERPNKAENRSEATKRKATEIDCELPVKSPKFSETDNDDCGSVYSSCVSSPEDKSTLRRKKNNEASKISRANRKEKQTHLFEREKELVKVNAELRLKIEKMTKEAEELRKVIIIKLSTGKQG
eukprot:Seg476.6 transcript_id=Seg476.6/GoldUCD/mRNA.D3Y31 product="hypothetical protein" protein_id=Seg476.6/GoldUCD/D3Y31